jgi:hypothetical protein
MAAIHALGHGLLRSVGWTNIAAGLGYDAWCTGAALQLLGLTARETERPYPKSQIA